MGFMHGYYMNTGTVLRRNAGIQVPANSAVAFRIVSLDSTSFDQILEKCGPKVQANPFILHYLISLFLIIFQALIF